MMKNMKISARLGGGFAAVVLLMVALIMIGLSALSSMNRTIDNIVNDTNAKIEAAMALRA